MAGPDVPASATTDNGVSNETSRLEQPSDAVPMESIPAAQSAKPQIETTAPAGDEPATTVPSASAADDVAAVPTTTTQDADTPESSDKPEDKSASAASAVPTRKDRSDSIMAIGPAQDEIKAMTPGGIDDGPVCQITLLFTSTGTRHPYKIDAKYLNRRNVPMPDQTESGLPDPFSISMYTLKELILREWRTDWETKPSSPSSIRLIYFGKLLDDKEQLKSE